MIDLSSLNPQQRQAVRTVDGPVLILAGAGTGKTQVITFRIAHMIETGILPSHILGVTFTNKAAREMQERLVKLLPKTQKPPHPRPAPVSDSGSARPKPTICTFHSLCVRILRQHIDKLGYKRNFVIYDEAEQLAAVKKVLSRISAPGEKVDPRMLMALVSRLKNARSNPANAGDPGLSALGDIVRKHYESVLRACNAVDFDDLILLTLRLFHQFPEALQACRAQYRYLLVDEYQDTNAAQFELVHALTREHRNLCVVGDDDQSIYGWRGAEVANLLNLEEHYPEVTIVKLEQNYRSTSTILAAANALIKNNPRRRPKQLWSQKGAGTKITLQAFPTDETEAHTVVEQIQYARLIQRIPWRDQAILFRTNIQSRPLEVALRKASVPYHLIGGQSFFDRREIKDFMAYLKLFVNPQDDISLLRIANVPSRGLSDLTMERILAASHERKSSVFAAMKNPAVLSAFNSRTRQALEQFVQLIESEQRRLVSETALALSTWADQLLTHIGYYDDLRRAEKQPETADNRVLNLKEFVATLDDSPNPALQPMAKLEEFLEEITLDTERAEEKENTNDAVTLITMHSCKGLEFPHVYIVGLEDGLLPHSRSQLEGTLDEERRLFYVAITRAMRTLTITHCLGRMKYGAITPCHPSRFLKELPPDLVEWADDQGKEPVPVTTGKDLFAAMRHAIG